MKKILLFSLLLTAIISCKNNSSQAEEETTSEKAESEKKITKRDYSINSGNAYSSLFLDSAYVESFIANNKLTDSVTRRLRSFYNARNFQYAWFSGDGLTEQGRSFWNLHQYYNTYSGDSSLIDNVLDKKMNRLVSLETLAVKPSDSSIAKTELTLTAHFIEYILDKYPSKQIKRKEMEKFVPYKKSDALYLADSLLTKKHKDNKYYADVNTAYKLLKDHLQKYYDIAKRGGWLPISTTAGKLAKGTSAPIVLELKKRLQVTGELPAGDTSLVYDDALINAVKTYQVSRGLTPTGIANTSLIKDMNVPVLKRIELILINMGRMRWMLNPEEGNLLEVNIPEFVLHVHEGGKRKFDMNVVVGKEGHNTTIFTGNLNQIVFSPYWNLTQNIVENEILPAMQRDPDYLAKHNMEQVGQSDGTPVIRQLPGEGNSLGKVKFLFPNSFDIYFHDTPAKALFDKDKRAYSHGCIRLSEPEKMANYLLRNQKEWTPEKINQAMNTGTEQYVKLKNPVPVLITYYTTWVDDKGVLNFRDDIYNHDEVLINKMFTNPL